jgi:hypothetical protein
VSDRVTPGVLIAVAWIWLIRRALAWRLISPRRAKRLVSAFYDDND